MVCYISKMIFTQISFQINHAGLIQLKHYQVHFATFHYSQLHFNVIASNKTGILERRKAKMCKPHRESQAEALKVDPVQANQQRRCQLCH